MRLVDLNRLSPAELDELGALLRDEAARRRVRLSGAEAWRAWETVALTPGWQRSRWADIGRLRLATRRLIGQGWRAEQVAEPMLAVAQIVVERALGRADRKIAEAAVAGGIADAGGVADG